MEQPEMTDSFSFGQSKRAQRGFEVRDPMNQKCRSVKKTIMVKKSHKRGKIIHSFINKQISISKRANKKPKKGQTDTSPLLIESQIILETEEDNEEEHKFDRQQIMNKRVPSFSPHSSKMLPTSKKIIGQINNFTVKRRGDKTTISRFCKNKTRNIGSRGTLHSRGVNSPTFISADGEYCPRPIRPSKNKAMRKFYFSQGRKRTPLRGLRELSFQKKIISPEPEKRTFFHSTHSGDLMSQKTNNFSNTSIGRYEIDMKQRKESHETGSSILGELKEEFMNAGNSKLFNQRMFDSLQNRIILPRNAKTSGHKLPTTLSQKKPAADTKPNFFMNLPCNKKIKKDLPLRKQINMILVRNQLLKMIKERKKEHIDEFIENLGKQSVDKFDMSY
ncbi:unnamed protein product [Moneuplotes crassus]|uniref:Uncharacterized protein n=1 Tax=Euplotes crassus TaxID=5936 RepID=A0AAD2CWR6_EUPCR|nr:unnamed protein product [Moneuplotes crassus]